MYQSRASIGIRFLAAMIDGIILGIFNRIFLIVYPPAIWGFAGVISFLYYGILEGSSMSATFGKSICGLIVVDEQGQPLSTSQGFLRALARMVTYITFGIGFLIAVFDEERKTTHDILAKTMVADKRYMTQQAGGLQNISKKSTSIQPYIVGLSGQVAGKSFPISQQGILIGRDEASCDVVLPSYAEGISRNHCKIQFNTATNMFVLYDLGSKYGTFLGNGNRIPQGQPVALRPSQEFFLANGVFRFQVCL